MLRGTGRRVRATCRGAALAIALAAMAAACSGSEHTEIGACPIRPGADCAGNYMRKSHLRFSVLYDANLDHADLTGVDLSWSNLAGASMRGAALAHANLRGAQLGYADLGGANLTKADLRGAVLTFANLYGAQVTGARFGNAMLCRTIMADGTIANPNC